MVAVRVKHIPTWVMLDLIAVRTTVAIVFHQLKNKF
jgi:hypothetical protein